MLPFCFFNLLVYLSFQVICAQFELRDNTVPVQVDPRFTIILDNSSASLTSAVVSRQTLQNSRPQDPWYEDDLPYKFKAANYREPYMGKHGLLGFVAQILYDTLEQVSLIRLLHWNAG